MKLTNPPNRNRRVWFVVPVVVFFVTDATLTLLGQPSDYWAGEHSAANEANPIAYQFIVQGPWHFAAGAALWLALLNTVILFGRQGYAGGLAVVVAFAHAVGGSTWMTRWGWWGWIAAAAYLGLASRFCRRCWKRAGLLSN